ncbi:hypothetical protein O181_031764 [Austropuccinia psidii MF-1]|uniref:Ribosomal protein S21 n=1 Tax=Austropuccinia psidii MF-1 TaxID=1389203 RepID=A0A9Q3CWB3_9BASI|nr:hypothetical protein [Austropuccinia psidii MF-1]
MSVLLALIFPHLSWALSPSSSSSSTQNLGIVFRNSRDFLTLHYHHIGMFLNRTSLRLASVARSPASWCSSTLSKSFSSSSNIRQSSTEDPFGFSELNSQESLKFRQPEESSPVQPPSPTGDHQDAKKLSGASSGRSTGPLGSTIFHRIVENQERKANELNKFDDQIRNRRNEKATLDQIWNIASQLRIQSHSGPLTPASSRVVRTVRAPPSSFLTRPVLASDVERSYKRLQGLLNASGLRKEIYLNKRYEKPFLMRRRLRSERHRRKFAIEVQRRVQIINVMKLKGI